jgi:hypothetical protein
MIQKISLDHQNCHIIHQNIMFRFIYTTTKGKRAPKSRSLFFRSIIYRIISSLWIRLCPKRKRQHCLDLCEDLSLDQQWRRDRSTVCGPVIPVRKAAKREQQWQQSPVVVPQAADSIIGPGCLFILFLLADQFK